MTELIENFLNLFLSLFILNLIFLIKMYINTFINMLEIPPFPSLKTTFDLDNLFSNESCSVAVIYCIYDKKRKTIVDKGTSRPCGMNHPRISIHAEQKCISYCRSKDKRRRYEIYIWRYSKEGKVKPVFCCGACSKLINKYGYSNRIYTFEKNQICSAMGQPYLTIGYQIKKQPF